MRTLAAVFLSLACGATVADTFQLDPDKIQFLGVHCQEITVDDITMDPRDPGYLHIDLNKMGPVEAVFAPKECTIKIPFTASVDKVASSVALSGAYTTPALEQTMATVGISRAGTVADAGVYIIKNSPTGEFKWKQPFEMEVVAGQENTLKIVISLLAVPPSTDSDGADTAPVLSGNKNRSATDSDTPSALSVFPLRLTVSRVVERPAAANLTKP